MSDQTFPFQDLSLSDIPSEHWKPIRGFEGRYDVSSFGRVKSLERYRVLHHGGLMPIQERILRQHLGKTKNHTVDDTLYSLIVTLNLDGDKYYFSVGRLVYNAFVAPLDLDDRTVLISFKDGDGRNLYYRNLLMTNISELRLKSYAQGRFKSDQCKPVSQFDVHGNLIAQYPSMYSAGRQNGIGEGAVAGAAANGSSLYKGFIWQAGLSKQLKKGTLVKRIDLESHTSAPPCQQTAADSQNRSTSLSSKNLQGEKWKDIPGYEKLYQISNYGRLKALAKISEGKVQRWCPERIKKLTPTHKQKKEGGLVYSSLVVTLCKNHKKRTYPVARLAYMLFVKAFDINNITLRVYTRDGDPYNIHYKNLMLKNATWSIVRKNNRTGQ